MRKKLELRNRNRRDIDFAVDSENELEIKIHDYSDPMSVWLTVEEGKQLRALLNQWLDDL